MHPDVMTVHHQKYYGGERHNGDVIAPTDFDSPNPISFVSVTGKFLLALAGPQAAIDVGWTILGHGLRELGLGAKTNAGYGRMNLQAG